MPSWEEAGSHCSYRLVYSWSPLPLLLLSAGGGGGDGETERVVEEDWEWRGSTLQGSRRGSGPQSQEWSLYAIENDLSSSTNSTWGREGVWGEGHMDHEKGRAIISITLKH